MKDFDDWLQLLRRRTLASKCAQLCYEYARGLIAANPKPSFNEKQKIQFWFRAAVRYQRLALLQNPWKSSIVS